MDMNKVRSDRIKYRNEKIKFKNKLRDRILDLKLEGRNVAQIAEEMHLPESTVLNIYKAV